MQQRPPEADLDLSWVHLVDGLVRTGTLRTPAITAAFRDTPRHAFVPEEMQKAAAAADAALPIGEGQTVSQPTTVAIMLELLQPRAGERVLDIGTGSGWQAALLAAIVGKGGQVYSVELVPALARSAAQRLRAHGAKHITTLVGDASCGLPAEAPFNIIVAAAESAEVPAALLDQLAPGGRLLWPIAGMGLRVIRKDAKGKTSTKDVPGFVFVPLKSSGEEPRNL